MSQSLPGWLAARALAHEAGAGQPMCVETISLATAVGRTLADDLFAPTDVPAHDGSAMDGWAVSGDGPWAIGAPIVAGDVPAGAPLALGAARPVTTGAPVPVGATRVVRAEDGEVDSDGRLVLRAALGGDAPRRRHIRPAGEEVRAGELLFTAGTILTPPRAALAAAAGVDSVEVAEAPVVAVRVLGDEIVGSGSPRAGQVRDVFTHVFPGILRSVGADPRSAERVPDDLSSTVAALDVEAKLVVTTGGTAASSTDHIRAALSALGAELVIDRTAMRPGHPVLLAKQADRLYLCLPGNPMAAMVCLVSLGLPLVAGLLGRPLPATGRVATGVDIDNHRDDDLVLAYAMGESGALPASQQSSAMLRGLTESEGLMMAPPGGARRGDMLDTVRLPW
ncbi:MULTISPECIES: molybdopterin molybdotransferase MoeA [unclassified Frondihabitans]|uniref:molybdopterin molybdotransferase MoeA n=1 Tax=unclassified Frondihabitans TaxID=2626248 RepID=UPI000F501CBD|nr:MULTISPECIES: molybdopterin molybdotransferase MoeA [unclassified Frondihabitans]RPE78745.1 molybdopterin molybdotransferase [Frondihabitans sp. PhB153]RPF09026.1 molybdopterin molybdotransferase [Frondihabitans sp. PhB161]